MPLAPAKAPVPPTTFWNSKYLRCPKSSTPRSRIVRVAPEEVVMISLPV